MFKKQLHFSARKAEKSILKREKSHAVSPSDHNNHLQDKSVENKGKMYEDY